MLLLARPRDYTSRRLWTFAAILFGLAIGSVGVGASARPLSLASEADEAQFVERLRQFRDASRVRWVIAAPDRADAIAKLARIEARLPANENDLAARVGVQTLEDASAAPGTVRAWMQPQFGASGATASCSWQVWVTDPAFPGAADEALSTPLSPNDRLPVSPTATFRVGHAGLLQSRLYAFGETHAGAIRDLAMAPDVNVPVATDPGGETILLASSREPTPFLDGLKTALADSQGRRIDLGPKFALREKLIGKSRGIGANIQAIPQSMIADHAVFAVAGGPAHDPAADGKLLETCAYVLSPTR